MGVLRSTQSLEAEVEELKAALLAGGGGNPLQRRCGGAAATGASKRSPSSARSGAGADADAVGRTVCVTGGLSFVGFAVVNRLLDAGFAVRLALETQEDVEKLREMEMFGEEGRDGVWTVTASVLDVDSLCAAFDGCTGVFHVSAFLDPQGVSGYSKHMAELETKVAERVVEACVRSPSVTRCIFTSSLLACVWRQTYSPSARFPAVVDENCWSDEALCRNKKLWFALGKTMAEKAAWRAARGRNLKLVTLCPALVTGPGFRRRNSTSSIAYLKGADELFADGLLATVGIDRVAEAHVKVYEALSDTAGGRYVCYDRIITRAEDAAELDRQLGIAPRAFQQAAPPQGDRFQLSNWKLSRLLSLSRRQCTAYVSSLAFHLP